MQNDFVKLTKQWIERFVIGLRLCPFAYFSYNNNTIFYQVSHKSKIKDCLLELINLSTLMNSKDQSEISNAFMIFDSSLSFDFILKIKQAFDEFLESSEFDVIFQSVVFHPQFQFADEDFNACGNFTNRSPFPMIHILREDEVANAIEKTENVDDIPFRNKRVLEDLEIKNMSEVFDDGFMDKIKQYI